MTFKRKLYNCILVIKNIIIQTRLFIALSRICTHALRGGGEGRTSTRFFARNRAVAIGGSEICITKTSRPNRFFAKHQAAISRHSRSTESTRCLFLLTPLENRSTRSLNSGASFSSTFTFAPPRRDDIVCTVFTIGR